MNVVEPPRLARQIEFVLEVDRLKTILRRTYLTCEARHENSAEHSWHLCVMALTLAEHANEPVQIERVLQMLVVHDIVEIDAGDTFVYDTQAAASKAQREQQAADRIFGLLPPDQSATMRALWDEFEAQATPDARFAGALDRLMPILHNYHTQGGSWREHGITSRQVLSRNRLIADGSETLWQYVQTLIADAVSKEYLLP